MTKYRGRTAGWGVINSLVLEAVDFKRVPEPKWGGSLIGIHGSWSSVTR